MTRPAALLVITTAYFNPHEREARDLHEANTHLFYAYFNPHERQARDVVSVKNSGQDVIF